MYAVVNRPNRRLLVCRPAQIISATIFLLMIMATACGGGPSSTSLKVGVAITTSQTTATLNVGANTTFSSTVINTNNTIVLWSVLEGVSGGHITSAGVYTAPATTGTYHVIASAQADPTKTATITITVIPALSVSINPTTAVTLGPAQSQTFTASVTNSIGSTAITWTVQEPSGGTISSTGVYIAPASPGTFHIVATAQVDSTTKAIATITVVPVSIAASTTTARLLVGQSQTFIATVSYAYDTSVAWSVQEILGGSVTSSGVYTAPVKAGTYHIIATSVADHNATATIAVTVNGMITTVAGHGTTPYPGDGKLAVDAELNFPTGVVLDPSGNLYITEGFRVRKVDGSTGIITTYAGTGIQGTTGDNGPAPEATLVGPTAIAIDASGNIYVHDVFYVRKVDAISGIISTVAGQIPSYGYSGDGGPATSALLFSGAGVAFDAHGNLFISDSGNLRIREVAEPTGVISTFAGTGAQGYGGDNGPAVSAVFNYPSSIAFDVSGNLYIADTLNNVIRKVTANGIITTVAGTGTSGYSGDGSSALNATFYQPKAVIVDNDGNLYIADTNNNVVRKVAASTGIITTVVGNGSPGYNGDDGLPTSAQLKYPWALALDSAGNLYVADAGNGAIRKVEW